MYNDMLSFELEQKRKSYQSQEKEICKDCKDRAGLPCLFVFSCDKLKQAENRQLQSQLTAKETTLNGTYIDINTHYRDIEKLQSENTRLKAEVNQYKEFKNYFDSLYGQGLEVANWHLNGSLEPFDNFFDSAVDEMESEQE